MAHISDIYLVTYMDIGYPHPQKNIPINILIYPYPYNGFKISPYTYPMDNYL
jgi:hypothetical protein